MTNEILFVYELEIGKYYKLITFRQGILMSEIQSRRIKTQNIYQSEALGKLIEIQQYGRTYDPDVLLIFQQNNGNRIEYEPRFGSTEAYLEYDPDAEESSKKRIQERTRLLELEIQGNDWALRPENVVATQGLDISKFAP
jgi:hypothetical protein